MTAPESIGEIRETVIGGTGAVEIAVPSVQETVIERVSMEEQRVDVMVQEVIKEVPKVEVQEVVREIPKFDLQTQEMIVEKGHVVVQEQVVEVPQVGVVEIIKEIPKVEVSYQTKA